MKTLITDSHSLISASRNGYAIPNYDDGFGPLFVHRDSMGITGIVRAQTWEDAYSICEDEFFPEANDTAESMEKEYSTEYLSGRELWERENGSRFTWQGLSVDERNAVYSRPGKDVPFTEHFSDHQCWQEAYGFRPNGQRSGKWENGELRDPIGHGIYSKDLNGDSLELLTSELAAHLEITLVVTENE